MGKLKRTLRERKFIAAYIQNSGNATKAYLAICPEAKHPREYGYRMLQKVDISTSELLDEMGMTDAFLNEILNAGLEAKKAVGLLAELVDDFPTRHKYLDTAYKLKSKYPAEKHELTGAGGEPIKFIIEKSYEQPKEGETEKTDEKDAI